MPKFEEFEITFEPHHNSLTASRGHFQRHVDAIAEFVDNSLEACGKHVTPGLVQVSLFLDSKNNKDGKKTAFLCISDNGVGMDTPNIKEFATLALDHAARGLENTGRAAIGMFGVGAKQAGSYLGNRTRLVTKRLDDERVLEFVIDKEKLEHRYKNGQEVYKEKVRSRPVSNTSLVPDDERAIKQMQEMLAAHEKEHLSFTYVIIRLHHEIIEQLLKEKRYNNIANELSEIYHFHLHPEHLPNRIDQIEKFKTAGGKPKK